MNISPFFRHLRSAYAAELDDMRTDSDGKNVLDKRLNQRRKELKFLVAMLETCPEMVATVFHKGFRFTSPAAMNHVISHESDELPSWDSLSHAITLESWAQPLATALQKEAMGDWFLTVAAALEYLNQHKANAFSEKKGHGEDHDSDEGDDTDIEDEPMDEDEREARDHHQAGEQWLVDQGFDHKE